MAAFMNQQLPKFRILQMFSLLLAIEISLSGCVQSTQTSAIHLPTTLVAATSTVLELTKTPTRTATPTGRPSSTLLPSPTPTLSMTPTATQPPILVQCIQPVDAQLSDLKLNGSLVINDNPFYERESNVYIHNMNTGKKVTIDPGAGRYVGDFDVSPDNTYIAYRAVSKNNLNDAYYVVLDASGKVIANHYAEKDWYTLVGWQDSQHLLITLDRRPNGYIEIPAVIVRWNPFSGNDQELLPDFPGIENVIDGVHKWGGYVFAPAVYDPAMQFVVYPSVQKEGKTMISLWSLISKKAIIEIEDIYGYYGSQPKWSPDGRSVLINLTNMGEKQEELYQVDIRGQLKQLTTLSRAFSEVEFGDFSWSPDGSQVAFWVRTVPDIWREDDDPKRPRTPLRLAVLNMNTGKVRSYCLPGEGRYTSPQGEDIIMPGSPIWSPGGDYLAAFRVTADQGVNLVIIDLANNNAWRFPPQMALWGWLKSSPMGWLATP